MNSYITYIYIHIYIYIFWAQTFSNIQTMHLGVQIDHPIESSTAGRKSVYVGPNSKSQVYTIQIFSNYIISVLWTMMLYMKMRYYLLYNQKCYIRKTTHTHTITHTHIHKLHCHILVPAMRVLNRKHMRISNHFHPVSGFKPPHFSTSIHHR